MPRNCPESAWIGSNCPSPVISHGEDVRAVIRTLNGFERFQEIICSNNNDRECISCRFVVLSVFLLPLCASCKILFMSFGTSPWNRNGAM
jgi:hypothetical protein